MDVFQQIPESFNLAAHVLRHAPAQPDKVALEIVTPARAERWSYARLEAAVLGLAGVLADRCAPGSRVLLRLGNTADFPIAYLAAIAADLVPVPTSSQLTEAEITASAATLCPSLVLAGDGIALPQGDTPVMAEADLRKAQTATPGAYVLGDPHRPGYIVQTSGTSGRPRFVVHAHRAVLARAMMHDGWEGLAQDDRLLHAGAFNWTYTLGTGLLDPWTQGATAVIPGRGVASMTLPLLLKRHDATIFAAAPGVYRQLLRGPLPDLPRLRHGLSAGEKLPDATRAAWEHATGTPIHEAYGQSEVSTFISGSPARPAPVGTLGFPQPGRRIALIEDGQPVPDGQSGQIAIHRSDPGVMLGYLGDPAPDEDWHLTGDWARFSPEGAVIYEGRHDDLINAGGLRVSPVEIESALTAHPDVEEAAAVALRVKADTEVIAAFYTGTAAPDDLTDHLTARLAAYKRPRVLERLDSLPRAGNNKLDRRALRAAWETEHGAT